MNIAAAKKIDLVEYLEKLGYQPSKIKREDYWYLSPLREEKTASFKINRKQNLWYDHGLGKGGTFIDFGILYHGCTVKELLGKLPDNFSFHQQPAIMVSPEGPLIKIISETGISSLPLLRYLKQRRIADSVAKKYCKEVVFSLHEKRYAAIGFKNNKGGFELRNQWFKGSSSPKGITLLENGARELGVFEGFFNFLAYQTITANQPGSPANTLVLNSTSFFEGSRALMERHETIRLFLDRDEGGERCTELALSWGEKYRDESGLYRGYNDLNEWQQQVGKAMKKGLKP